MIKLSKVFFTIILLLAGVLPLQALPLAKDGQALQPIVISSKASEKTKSVAAELAEYLKRITGAEFKVENGDGGQGIVLGTLEEFPQPELQKPLEIRERFDGVEAFAITTKKDRVLLIGRTDLAVSHVAFRFLEELGYRHFFPAKEWEVVPSIPNLNVEINLTNRPKILSRSIWFGYGYFRPRDKPMADYETWKRHNRMAESVDIAGGHSWQRIISKHQEEFDKHPEYYALVNGQRKPSAKLELGNPAVRKMVVDYALEYFRNNPAAHMVSLDPSDGLGFSESPESQKLGTISDAVFGIVNEAARAVQKEFPGKMVGTLAYSAYTVPPSFELEPNVYVQLTVGFNYGPYSFAQLMEMWSKKAKKMGFREYYSVWAWDGDKLPGGRANDVSYLEQTIKSYAEHNAISISAESGNNWGPHGRGYYLANKLMWNPDADASAILDDFYKKAFGPAAAPMKRYYERFDRRTRTKEAKPRINQHLFAMGFRDVQEATQLAKDQPEVLARLDHLKQYLHYVHLRWLFDRTRDKDEKRQLMVRAMSWVNRSRFSYMNHWQAMQRGWVKQVGKTLADPSWWSGSKEPSPWDAHADEPLTRAEIHAAFAEGLKYFQPNPPGEQVEFSRDLVPIQWDVDKDTVTAVSWRSPVSYALYSFGGEPLKFGVQGGIISLYRDRVAPTVTISDAQGMDIAEISIPHDGQRHDYIVPVPAPGLYFFDIVSTKAGWKIFSDATTPATVVLQPDEELNSGGAFPTQYFYVPKNTKVLRYYWAGRGHELENPEGATVVKEEIASVSKNYAIKVPPDKDGKLWSFGGRSVRSSRVWFYNVPNVIASSPSALMVPREVAEEDGLVIRTK